MADKQSGTGARGDKTHRPEGQGRTSKGNHVKTSDNNRSQQRKNQNKSSNTNDRGR